MSILIAHVSTLHSRDDARIVVREMRTLLKQFDGEMYLVVSDAKGDESIFFEGREIKIIDIGELAGGRFIRATRLQIRCLRKILSLKPKIVHFHDPELVFLGLIMKITGSRVIYDAHEDLPKQILSKEWIKRPLRRVFAYGAGKIEYVSSYFFDAVICATPDIERRFRNRNTAVLYNYPLREEFTHISQVHRHREIFRMVYIGAPSRIRGIKMMIEVTGELTKRGRQVELCIAGEWEPSLLEECSAYIGWQQTHILKKLPRIDVLELLRNSDLGMLLVDPTPNHLQGMPVKLFEYCGSGLPVLASDYPKMRSLVMETKVGLVVDATDILRVCDAVETIMDDNKLATSFSNNGKLLVNTVWNWESQENTLINVYIPLLGEV